MLQSSPAAWSVRGATFALWALAAGSAAFWGLQLGGGAQRTAAPVAAPRAVAAVDAAAIARLLGSTPAPGAQAVAAPSLASRFQLVGVVAGVQSGGGAAVLSVDGKPARPYRVGANVDDGLVLQSVRGRTATLAATPDGPAVLTLELPPLRQ